MPSSPKLQVVAQSSTMSKRTATFTDSIRQTDPIAQECNKRGLLLTWTSLKLAHVGLPAGASNRMRRYAFRILQTHVSCQAARDRTFLIAMKPGSVPPCLKANQ